MRECTATSSASHTTPSHFWTARTLSSSSAPMPRTMRFYSLAEYLGIRGMTCSSSPPAQPKKYVFVCKSIILTLSLLQSVSILYKAACDAAGLRAIALNTFCTLWRNTLPFVTAMKPMTDLCQVCQHNSTALVRAANTAEEDKSEVSSM